MSTFTILVFYVAGIICIGLPLGVLALRSWCLPSKYPRIGRILFPYNGLDATIGEIHSDGEGSSNLPYFMDVGIINYYKIVGRDKDECAKYIIVTSLVWPARLAYVIIAGLMIVATRWLQRCLHIAIRFLASCKRCIEIS